jgi:glycerol kinase
MPFVLALDQGTTSSRAVVYDERGAIRASAQREFEQHFPRPGWVEHDPADIWSSQVGVAQEALARAQIRPRDVSAIGITNQRETTLVWERATGRPIHRAIVWQDRRTADLCARLAADGHERLVRERTGLVIDPYFSATKLAWILDHVEGARQRGRDGELCFGTVDSWLLWNLTGGALHATDATNASRTMLYDIRRGQWDDELLGLLDIPRAMLPEVRGCSEVYAESAPDIFASPIPIAGIAGDQHASLFGQRCTRPGMVKNTYGTGCFLLMNTGDAPVASENGLVSTLAWQIGDEVTYALEGSVFIAGAVVQWLRDGLGLIRRSEDVEALAAQVDDADGVFLVPAFTGLGAPHWDPHARGTMVGITRGTTAAHLARAALEGIAFQVADVVDAMHQDARLPAAELRVDGGAARNDLLMQFQADLLGAPVVRPDVFETTSRGAAYLAGLASGVWPDAATIDEQWQAEARFEPAGERQRGEALRAGWRRAVETARFFGAG